MSDYEKTLAQEIEFWRRTLDKTAAEPDGSVYQRIANALAFAEYRLASLQRELNDEEQRTESG